MSNKNKIINYTIEEDALWHDLFMQQKPLLQKKACDEYLYGLDCLEISSHTVPQLRNINRRLHKLTKWEVVPVQSMLTARVFFEFLAERRFPIATFLRLPHEREYVKKPDIFHEIIGHCPMLANSEYANFLQNYAKVSLALRSCDLLFMERLFVYTVEFGLINKPDGLRIYGAGILSSAKEIVRSTESKKIKRVLFDPFTIVCTPYYIDKMQEIYFIINSFNQLYDVLNFNFKQLILSSAVNSSRELLVC